MKRSSRVALIGGAALAAILVAAWFVHHKKQPEGTLAIETAGSQPGWRFARSDPPGRLSLVYQFPGRRMQFVGACHQGPVFFYLEQDIAGTAPIVRIDGLAVSMRAGAEHGGILFDDTPESIARIAAAKQSIELVDGNQRRMLKPVPDIAAFVVECRKLVAAGG